MILEYAAPLLAEGGRLVAWKGAVSAQESASAAAAAQILGLEPLPVLAVTPFPGARDHTLHSFRKVAPTPSRFPRRPGMATKRPLGLKGQSPLFHRAAEPLLHAGRGNAANGDSPTVCSCVSRETVLVGRSDRRRR